MKQTIEQFLIAELEKVNEQEAIEALKTIEDRVMLDKQMTATDVEDFTNCSRVRGKVTLGVMLSASFYWPDNNIPFWAELSMKYATHVITPTIH